MAGTTRADRWRWDSKDTSEGALGEEPSRVSPLREGSWSSTVFMSWYLTQGLHTESAENGFQGCPGDADPERLKVRANDTELHLGPRSP